MFWKKTAVWLLILMIVGLLIIPHAKDAASPAESAVRGDALHFPVFLLLTLLIFSLLRKKSPLSIRITTSAIIMIALAAGTELIQSFTPGRMASRHDLIANFLGIIAALTGLWIWKNSPSPRLAWSKALHILISLLIATALSWPYFQHLNAHRISEVAFPVLSDFRNPHFALIWKTQNGAESSLSDPSAPANQSFSSLEVTLPGKNSFEGINYLPGSQDWSPHKRLHLLLINPGQPFRLGIRIDDDGDCSEHNSRFSGERLLQPGKNHFTVKLETIRQSPQTRDLNLGAIHRLLLFTQENSQTQKFSIVRVWLE